MNLPRCGEGPFYAPEVSGCGEPIERVADLYRCVSCTIPFHRDCAARHFKRQPEPALEVEELPRGPVLLEATVVLEFMRATHRRRFYPPRPEAIDVTVDVAAGTVVMREREAKES